MTNKGLSRRYVPSLAKTNYYDIIPEFASMWNEVDASWKEMERLMGAMQGGIVPSGQTASKNLAYQDRSEKEQEFSIWTKGTYPKLNINKILDSETSTLKELQIIAAVPGCSKEEVDVAILGGEITIECGKHLIDKKAEEEKVEEEKPKTIVHNLVTEIPERFSRVMIDLMGPFDFENATADFPGDGTLVIVIPAKVIEKEKPRSLLS